MKEVVDTGFMFKLMNARSVAADKVDTTDSGAILYGEQD